jgi:SAM-dependent methyltransferase
VKRSLLARLRAYLGRRLNQTEREAELARAYRRHDYLDAYAAHTDQRVAMDPREAVGGMWEVLGALQLDFLKAEGLAPAHRLLDIGCGTLRGGRHFIAYLDRGHYTGLDISPAAIHYAEQLVLDEGLAGKAPHLVLSRAKDLKFMEFGGQEFDYLLAQSVFTHLPPEHIEACLAHVGQVMGMDSAFYFTFHRATEAEQTGLKDFRYPLSFFQDLAGRHGFKLQDRSAGYPHPRGQRMVKVTKG